MIICVKSCVQHQRFHDLIRNTWGQDAQAAGIPVRFFMGGDAQVSKPDESVLDCDDSYNGLPAKTRAICQYNIFQDFIFLVDVDAYLNIPKLLASDFRSFDYYGVFNHTIGETFSYTSVSREGIEEHHERVYPWASGHCYALSIRAIPLIARAEPNTWAEDFFVGQTLHAVKIGDSSAANFSSYHRNDEHVPLDRWMRAQHRVVSNAWAGERVQFRLSKGGVRIVSPEQAALWQQRGLGVRV